jgi:hypothetical protein
MKIAVTVTLLVMSLGCVTVPADASASMVGVVGAPASMGWSTGGFAADPPPPPVPDWCTPDNPDPACHPPPPQHYHRGHGILLPP